MIYFLSFIIVLGIPVFLHELGHFLAAKSVGIKVEKFYVGFNFFGWLIEVGKRDRFVQHSGCENYILAFVH